ncbi:uncharacterized protein FIBRA_01361 [Fibroporia radiculosa]|uniref:TRAPPC10/Trs130 C-terminal domain-containing protein n=1 Tax=Fibroporia radiculosa TaxID=599839 RepID=J4G0Y1_9APHY|nr:uncharacterized protein FIBRA_01361 [Fibroporia radiculosa]CCL99343.1 predicted protein [Fibroporia radiculosa]
MAVEETITESPLLRTHRERLVDKLVQALASDARWIELYDVTGELTVPDVHSMDGEISSALSRIQKILARQRSNDFCFGEWREIIIPVDVPQMHILCAARLRVLINPSPTDFSSGSMPPLFAGQPISAVISVHTSFHWAPPEDAGTDGYVLRYDIEDMTGDWLVSGRKKGDFLAKDGSTFSARVTLIALHHGELSLPKIGVAALPLSGEARMGLSMPSSETFQMHGAEKVLVLPRGGRSTFVIDMGRDNTSSSEL